ncbi:MAG: hypothetical protein HBSAPP03_01970 [Phycisphaerae bacterium]|nr:MAG: hypothetical protein HBSAPP03_01970 [Phycisphaerae bacterium]
MWLRKAALAAALFVCAPATLADAVRVTVAVGSGRQDRIISRPGQVGGLRRDRVEHHHRPRDLVANLCIDGREVRAMVTTTTDHHGRLVARVRFESRDGRRLPRIGDVHLDVDQSRRDFCIDLARSGHGCDDSAASFVGVGERLAAGHATFTLRVGSGRHAAVMTWRAVPLDRC